MTKGRLNMILPDGQSVWFGQGQDCPPAVIRVIDNAFFCKCVLFGDVGFAESYMDGDWETANIKAVIEWMIRNLEQHPTLMADTSKYKPVNFFKFLNDLYHVWRPNTVAGSRSNIEKHYDLGNDFFRLFLDPGMTYSSACFSSDDDSLEQAQANKYERLCQKLRLKHTDHVLEIGCGWGGFALYAARNYGCRVTGVTISKEQHDYALRRVEREGMSGRVRVILEDYRSVKGRYDKIVSIEMIEAVGHEFYGSFFSQCHRLLKQEGLLAMQMILSPDHRYQSFRRTTDFIQKHIFPGSLLPSFPVLHRAVNGTGTMCLYDYEDITPHYVRTLMLWQERFRQNRQAVQDLGFSRQFLRKWEYYFEYCAAAFEMRNISVAQAVFTRPNNLGLGRPYALH
ncbi:MAG: class I SAM-dependent methyltransferase [Candidatus Omnitrophica bacterium]|nr:class I SAM-dependent methyltransferase [Candidatus Omnitrophota bacterium]MDE2222095.1 class I SAM-dependent methyltransferase [Candidatus Omnitrophota bacterium]